MSHCLDGALVGLGHEDDELVASITGRDIGVADVRPHHGGQVLESVVAGGVPERVVHQLEAVEVEHQNGERMPVALVELHVPVEFLFEEPTVVQTGEGIGVRQAIELGAGLLMIGFGGCRHDPMKGDAHDADQPQDLFVLLTKTAGESLPDGLFEGVEAFGEGPYPCGLVALEKPEGRRLPMVEAARAELRPECPHR